MNHADSKVIQFGQFNLKLPHFLSPVFRVLTVILDKYLYYHEILHNCHIPNTNTENKTLTKACHKPDGPIQMPLLVRYSDITETKLRIAARIKSTIEYTS